MGINTLNNYAGKSMKWKIRIDDGECKMALVVLAVIMVQNCRSYWDSVWVSFEKTYKMAEK